MTAPASPGSGPHDAAAHGPRGAGRAPDPATAGGTDGGADGGTGTGTGAGAGATADTPGGGAERPDPSGAVRIVALADCGVAVPAWTLRVLVGVVAIGVVAVVRADGGPIALLTVGGLLAVASVLSPGSAAPAALAGTAVLVSAVYTPIGQLRPSLLGLVFLAHLLHESSALAAVVPRGARVHLSALRRPAVRFAAVQLGVLGLVGLAYVLPGGRNPWHLEVIAILGVAALAALALFLLRRP